MLLINPNYPLKNLAGKILKTTQEALFKNASFTRLLRTYALSTRSRISKKIFLICTTISGASVCEYLLSMILSSSPKLSENLAVMKHNRKIPVMKSF